MQPEYQNLITDLLNYSSVFLPTLTIYVLELVMKTLCTFMSIIWCHRN